MSQQDKIKAQIVEAFKAVPYPGDKGLRGSDEGDEPFMVEREFHGKRDWRSLQPKFLDQAPEGLGSALSFLSHEAFHYFLPAYLIADLDGLLERVDPVFHLTHGLDNRSCGKGTNPQRYGKKTWNEYACERFEAFSRKEAAAIIEYLRFKLSLYNDKAVKEALQNYWEAKGRE